MPTAMVTFNGRITIPTQVRRKLGLKIGDKVDFVEVEKGRFAICSQTRSHADTDRRDCESEFTPDIDEMEKVTA